MEPGFPGEPPEDKTLAGMTGGVGVGTRGCRAGPSTKHRKYPNYGWRPTIKAARAEMFSFYSHFAGIITGLAGLIFLVIRAWGRADLVAVSLVYGFAMAGLFSFSSIYHFTKQAENASNIWRKLDHIAIFFMIAGTYTPVCYIFLTGTWRWGMIIASWSFVAAGIILKVFFIKAPRVLSTVLYLMMGWLAVIPLRLLWQNMPRQSFFLILAGGLAYSAGAIMYALKKPNPLPGRFGFHEIFHVMILIGAALHYAVVYMAIGS